MDKLSRRQMLSLGGSSAVALLGDGAFAQRRQNSDQQQKGDPVRDHIFGEAVRLAEELRLSRRPDTIAALAANFRLHAAHARASGLDARLAAAAGREVDRGLRDALIDAASGPEMDRKHREMLQSLGLGDLHAEMATLPRSAYEDGLNAILAGSVTRALENTAISLEQMRSRIGKLSTPQGGTRVQLGCEPFRVMCEFMKQVAAVICAIAAVQPEFAPLCPIFAVEAATACFMAWLGGC